MKRKWIKILIGIVLAPVFLILLVIVLLYVPPVQHFLRREATAIASEATGLEIAVDRIDLRFPLNLLVRGVQVVQPVDSTGRQAADTLLRVGSLNAHVQAWPLLKGHVEIDGIRLRQVRVHSADLLDGIRLSGELGELFLESHYVDLSKESVVLNEVSLSDTRLTLQLADTTQTPPDTTAASPVNWKLLLHRLQLENVSVDLAMPLDSLRLMADLGTVLLENASADLGRQSYAWQRFRIQDTKLSYDNGAASPVDGFDASHIALRDLQIGIDSLRFSGRDVNAVIREFSVNERSGLSIVSLNGRLHADSSSIAVPSLQLVTSHSDIYMTLNADWQLLDRLTAGNVSARFHANIGKQDVLLFAGGLPESFKASYPFRPLTIHAGTEGNLSRMQLSGLSVDLPGAFSLSGRGELYHLTDSLMRNARLNLDLQTGNLNFLTALSGTVSDGSLIIPDSMRLSSDLAMDGSRFTARLNLDEAGGALDVDAVYDMSTDAYRARVAVDSMQLHHFLPKDSLYNVSATFEAEGRGVDFKARSTLAKLHLMLNELQYGGYNLSDVVLDAGLKDGLATARLASHNPLLDMKAVAETRLDRSYLNGRADVEVAQVDLCRLGLIAEPLKRPFAFNLGASLGRDSVDVKLSAGDLDLSFRARNSLEELLACSGRFMDALTAQIEERRLDHAALRRVLPSAGLYVQAGRDNPVSDILATRAIRFNSLRVGFAMTPEIGINGRSDVDGFRMDSLQLDTLFLTIQQDTTRMRLQGGVVNGPSNPQFVFRAILEGEIRNRDAGLTLNYTDGKGRTGVLFGLNARPLTEGHGRGNGVLLQLIPDKPVIAYRQFDFTDGCDKIYIHKDMHVYAHVDMLGDDGIRFQMQSDLRDTAALQNINISLNRFKLSELSSVMPYLPKLTGLLSAKAHYIQTEEALQVSADLGVQQLTYEGQPVGDIGLGGSWLPGEKASHALKAYVKVDGEEVLTADGSVASDAAEALDVTARISRLPLRLANAFVPDGAAMLAGHANGELNVRGSTASPRLQGSLALDSTSVYLRQLGARFWFDNRPLRLESNKLLFDKYAIYTTGTNPFTIDGSIDLGDMSRMVADLRLYAQNYTLLDAPRTRESMVYGKVCVDLAASVKGPLDALVMRGNMNLLGNTDVTYVLTDSPLTVEDRLDGLVEFTSFADTLSTDKQDVDMLSLGGMDMLLTVHIDDAVRLRADLSPDRSKFVELEGGGDLSLQYSQQGNMTLTGRYTLSGGIMKYSLPIIPLKEFQFTTGSYVDWRGDLMDPILDLKASERIRASVANGGDNEGTRIVNFDVSIAIRNRLSAPELIFDLSAPEDATVENELQTMGAEERSKQAIAMLATGVYLNSGVKGGGLDMGSALNSVLQSQINALAGSALESVNASFSVGVEDRTSAETGDKQTDYSFRYSQRFFNDRIQIVIGGKVSTGANAANDVESFIDNISVEYRLDASGTRYIRVFHDKNYDSVLDGEVTETGLGLVLRRKMDRLGELFIFRRKEEKP